MVSSGYQQTELGALPDDWDVHRIGDILAFKNGLNKAKAYFGHGTPIINYMDVFSHSGLDTEDVKGRVSVTTNEQSTYDARKGDVFFTRTSETVDEIGMSAVLLADLDKAVFSGFVLRGRDKSADKKLTLGFKKYCFSSEGVRHQIRSSASYTTRALTNGTLLSGVLLPVPSDPDEQDSIATVLSDVDALIESLEALIAKKRAIKTATMQQLLTGQTRLPGFGEGVGTKQTELGEIPEDWEVVRVGQAATKVGSGVTPRGGASVYKDAGRPFVRSQNVGWGTPRPADLVYIDESIHQTLPSTEILENDVLLNITGASIGRSCLADVKFVGGNVNQHVCIIRTDARLHPRLLSLLILSDSGQRQIESFQAGGNREGLNFSQVRALAFPVPSDPTEQADIASISADIDRELVSLDARLAKTKALKKGMMQELLTGRTRLV
jgi:type I restriction enzyme S subunit